MKGILKGCFYFSYSSISTPKYSIHYLLITCQTRQIW